MDASPVNNPRWGLWLLGARGSVATTMTVGWAAMVANLAGPQGMVTQLSAFDGVGLPGLSDLVIGGCDIGQVPLVKRAEQLETAGVVPRGIAERVADDLATVDARLTGGVSAQDVAAHPAEALARLQADLAAFRSDHDLDRVVVVNVASTEPPVEPHDSHSDVDVLLAALDADQPVLSPAPLMAVAALTSGAAFVDFTPSSATVIPAIQQLAERHGLPLAGRDGKTGETLLKTALAPMFADRALKVRSWSGMNLLGGGDGQTLADPVHARSKLESKAAPLQAILGYQPDGPVRIDHVADLGDWKTAWDLITFEGFLGTRMQLQFTWQGCDSALAAPLVLDLARLVALAMAAGESGPLPALAYFFKDPVGSSQHRLAEQFTDLIAWTRTTAATTGTTAP